MTKIQFQSYAAAKLAFDFGLQEFTCLACGENHQLPVRSNNHPFGIKGKVFSAVPLPCLKFYDTRFEAALAIFGLGREMLYQQNNINHFFECVQMLSLHSVESFEESLAQYLAEHLEDVRQNIRA